MSRFIQTVMLWTMAEYYGLYVLFNIIKDCFQKGFWKVLQWSSTPKPKVLDDPTLGTHGLLTLDDVKIHYVASGPEDKPLMLFVHGFPEFWFSWRHQIREFQKDYRVVAIDQRGYGESSKPNGISQYTVKKLMSDIRQVILALGYKKCILVAHDWGGAVAWPFGRLFPDMVEKLIIMNAPSSPVFQKILYTNKRQLKMSWKENPMYMFFFQLPYLPEFSLKTNNYHFFDNMFGNQPKTGISFSEAFQNPLSQGEVDAYKYTFSQPGALTPPINYYRATFRSGKDRLSYDMDYSIPVLLIWGCKDVALCKEIPEETKKANPNITVKLVQDAGHFVQMDTPDLVNKIMREWLEK